MAQGGPRADEQAALDAVLAVADVDEFEWLPESHEKTPDLRLRLSDGRVVFMEVTLAADQAAMKLKGSGGSKKPFRFKGLSWNWKVWIREGHAQERDAMDRSLKQFVQAMVPVLADSESEGFSPTAMRNLVNTRFDDGPYDIDRDFPEGPRRRWLSESPPEMEFEEWALGSWLRSCDYWYVPDLQDAVLHGLRPRRVFVVRDPAPAEGSEGSIEVHVSPTQPAFMFSAADHLLAAIDLAVGKKQQKNQMKGVDGGKWLAVAVTGNAAAQLEEACAPENPAVVADLSGIRFEGFDELWVFGPTFQDWRFAVARFAEPGRQPTLCTVPRHPKAEQDT